MIGLVNFSIEPGSVELRDVPVPEIDRYDVLLEVKAVGICGSDLHQYHSTHSWKVNYPIVLGHEFGGINDKIAAVSVAQTPNNRADVFVVCAKSVGCADGFRCG